MAVVDEVLSQTERRTLDRIRDLLGVPRELAAMIEAEIPGLA
ncbi:MAG: hypothetical protein ACTHU0_25400 [Kofleriaceae bacterium]